MTRRYEDDPLPRLTQEQLEELRRTTPHATLDSIGAEPGEEATPEFIEDLLAYLHHFAAPKRGDDGKPVRGNPCLRCGEALMGDLAQQLLGRGGFEWGTVHGRGHCRRCGWPATLYHFVKDRDGQELVTIRNVLLQAHPDDIEIQQKTAAA